MQSCPGFDGFLADRERHCRIDDEGRELANQWNATEAVSSLGRVLQDLSEHLPSDKTAFASALASWTDDRQWISDFIAIALAAIKADPFAALPWRLQNTSAILGLGLLSRGRASCTMSIVDADMLALSQNNKIVFDSGYSMTIVIAGGPIGVEHFSLVNGGRSVAFGGKETWTIGDWRAQDCAVEQVRLVDAAQDTVLVRIAVAGDDPGSRVIEFDLRDSDKARYGIAVPSVSRHLALLEIAAQSGDDAIIPVLVDLCRHPEPMLRWQSLRFLTARNFSVATPFLEDIALHDQDSGVRAVAAQTLVIVARTAAAKTVQ